MAFQRFPDGSGQFLTNSAGDAMVEVIPGVSKTTIKTLDSQANIYYRLKRNGEWDTDLLSYHNPGIDLEGRLFGEMILRLDDWEPQ